MKKRLLWLAAILFAVALQGQEKPGLQEHRSSLSFHAGVSFPIICYASRDFSNKFAGFAKPGFTFNVHYSYRFGEYFGLAGSAFYSSNKTDSDVRTDDNHYHYIGLVAGPMLRKKFSERTDADLKFMAGIARTLSPKMVYQGQTLMNKDVSASFVWTAGAAFRYHLNERTFLSFKADHTQLTPKFDSKSPEQSLKGEQHIVVLNVDAGVGIKF